MLMDVKSDPVELPNRSEQAVGMTSLFANVYEQGSGCTWVSAGWVVENARDRQWFSASYDAFHWAINQSERRERECLEINQWKWGFQITKAEMQKIIYLIII